MDNAIHLTYEQWDAWQEHIIRSYKSDCNGQESNERRHMRRRVGVAALSLVRATLFNELLH